MSLAFSLNNCWDLISIASIYADLASFSAVRHHDVGGVMEKSVIELARGCVVSRFDSSLGVSGECRNAEQHFERGGSSFTISRQTKLSATLTNRKEVAESGIHPATKY
jgi:hypothetical protein